MCRQRGPRNPVDMRAVAWYSRGMAFCTVIGVASRPFAWQFPRFFSEGDRMNSSDLEAKLLRGAAYRIFFEEVQRHVDGITTLCNRADLSSQEVAEAAGRFHTIKGGAGFFKLVELAGVAGALENGLKGVEAAHAREKLSELEPLLARLRAAVAALPKPQSEG